jgi:hypothetical protein
VVAVWWIDGFRRAEAPVTVPVTKFGGRPVWLGPPQWPLSAAWQTPMRFVGQIALEPFGAEGLAYVFVTDGEDFDPDVIDPEGGENAVVVQPGDYAGPTAPLTDGPTVSPDEYTPDLTPGEDRDLSFAALDRDKLGGIAPLQGDPPPGGPWRLLLRLATNWTPFPLNLGAAPVAFAFLSADGRDGRFLVEDS